MYNHSFDIVIYQTTNLLKFKYCTCVLQLVFLFSLHKLGQLATVRAIPFASRYGLKLEAILMKPFNFTFPVVTCYHKPFLRTTAVTV